MAEGILAGRRVVVTRAHDQAAELGALLAAQGAEVIYCPMIRVSPPADPEPFQRAVRGIEEFDWVVVTSVNGVTALIGELARQGRGAEALQQTRVGCVGPATARALRHHGVEPAAMPAEYLGAEIADVMADRIRAGERRVLLARAAGATAELPARLRGLGADVIDVESYRTVADTSQVGPIRNQLEARSIDLITFTSPSTATHFVENAGKPPDSVAIAAIGPVTAARVHELGLRPSIVADDHTAAGLVRAITSFFSDSDVSRGRD